METIRNILRSHPYACFLLGFASVVSFGIYKLLAILERVA